MPIYMLTDERRSPPPEGASPEGIVAIGGDFRAERLLLGYAQGIFPPKAEPRGWRGTREYINLAYIGETTLCRS